MLKELFITSLLATSFNIKQPNTTTKKEEINNTTETRSFTLNGVEIATENYNNLVKKIFYYEGQQQIDTATYQFNMVVMSVNSTVTNDIVVSSYARIKKINYEQPNSNITFHPTFTFSKQNNFNITYDLSLDYQTNVANKDATLFDIDYLKRADVYDLLQDDDIPITETEAITNLQSGRSYFYNAEWNKTKSYLTMNDGYMRFSQRCIVEITDTQNNQQNHVAFTALQISYEVNQQTIEVVDIPGIMFTILGMPFSFIAQAFNLTLFPGTPYQINVANVLFALIVALIVIFIIRKFWG